jgi:Caspase domain
MKLEKTTLLRVPNTALAIVMAHFSLFFLALLSLIWSAPADARKVALVIGNSIYANTSSLTNPANDAQLIAGAARQAGFEVITLSDLTMASFQRALRDFRAAADGSEIAMIYYAGHGIEGQGKNWLIPVDSKLETDFDLPYEAINMDRLLEALAGAQVRMVILDACRNNPFGNAWKTGVRAVPRGLNGTEFDDVLVIYAAAPGQTAADGAESNSPFATSLAKRIPEVGLPLQMLGGAVRDDVLTATGGKQRPFVSASITGTPVYLVGPSRVVSAQPLVVAAAPVVATGADRSMMDALMWQGAISSNTAVAFQAYLREFPSGVFSNVARESIAKLRPAAVAAQPVAAQPAVAQPASVQVAAPRLTPPAAAVTAAPIPVVALSPAPKTEVPSYLQPRPDSVSTFDNSVPALLPTLPPAPRFTNDGYPTCREEFQSIVGTNEKVGAINRCTVALDQYSAATLSPYRRAMIEHQKRISAIYSDQVGGKLKYSSASQDQFFKAMMKEHAESNPEGSYFAEQRAADARYQADRAYMQDRYCFHTGCGGYAVPVFVPGASSASKK